VVKGRIKEVVELSEYFRNGYKNLCGCSVHVTKITKVAGGYDLDLRFEEHDEDSHCTEIQTDVFYSNEFLSQQERLLVKNGWLKPL
jgi:hypothetical protein